jgi:predicted nucleic acid-binding protein
VAYLIDTSILARLANTADTYHALATQATVELHRRGEVLHVTPQNLIEFRNMATRPAAVNGLGLAVVDAETKAATFEATFPLLAETPGIFPAWKALVRALGVVGKQVHDARLVAVCHVHGVSHLLTFNVVHFARLAAFEPGVVVVDPASI